VRRARSLPLLLAFLALGSASCRARPRPAPAPSPTPRTGGVFRFALTEPRGLDPAFSEDAYQWLLIDQIFDGLVSLDAELNIVPGLAKTWTVSPDGLHYRFTLRPEARFHNGRPVTADDVAWSFARAAQAPGGLAREYLGNVVGGSEAAEGRATTISGIQTDGPHELLITLAHSYAPFLGTLAIPTLRVVPREDVEARGPAFARSPVGTGAFKVQEWRPGRRLVLTANEGHWAGRPYLDRVEVLFEGWEDDAVEPFLRGDVDAALVTTKDLARLPKDVNLVERYELGMTCLGLNLAFPPMDDLRVRRAAAMSLDRDAIVKSSGRVAVPSRGIVPFGIAGGAPGAFAPERDLENARRLLAEAGYPGPRGLPVVDLWANRASPRTRDVAEAIARNLWEVGIQVRHREASWAQLLDVVDAGKAPAYLLTWVADTPDRDSFLGVLFHSKGANNYLHYEDAEVDRLIDDARRDMDPMARARLYHAAEERIGAASVLIPLFSQASTYAVRRGVEGFNLDPMGQIDLSRIYWEPPR
jgi:ABC-type transport system substrate-binding protein